MQRGEYQSKICPYGYRKSADGRMEIDENVAEIVRLIFRWAAEGTIAAEITRKSCSGGISPHLENTARARDRASMMYRGRMEHGAVQPSCVCWRMNAISAPYVIGKRAVTEIGGHRIRLKDESEWYKIPDHHPAIVSKELFEQAKAGIRRFSIPNKKQHDYPLRRESVLRLLRPCTVTDYTISEVPIVGTPR